jgi:hypothetical protein
MSNFALFSILEGGAPDALPISLWIKVLEHVNCSYVTYTEKL